MRIALVGKGGSGKTTIASLLMRYLMAKNRPVLAIDADINQHLADAAGWQLGNLPEVGNNLSTLKIILRGKNTLIPSPDVMVKNTLPGQGSHCITMTAQDPILQVFSQQKGNAWFIRIGGFKEEDLGQRCFHAKTGGAELILNHLIDRPEETVLVDMTAGADAFASGLFSRFDLTILVVEPTMKSVSVYEQYKTYAKHYPIAIRAVGNKVEDADDITFLKEKCGDELLGWFSHSRWVKKTEQGQALNITQLEPNNLTLLKDILTAAEDHPRDWQSYWEWGIYFHKLNARGWANDAMGCDVSTQIDEEFLKNFCPEDFYNNADLHAASTVMSKPNASTISLDLYNTTNKQ